MRYLALHGANCLDETPQGVKMSTLTLDERVEWMERHAKFIERLADDPLADRWWMAADQPLQFYAFAVEWTAARRSGNPAAYVSALPVAQDGSCNGIQHFSAMLRDERGGAATNLTAARTPSDLYELVARDVLAALEADASFDFPAYDEDAPVWPSLWLTSPAKVNRKLAKRPTMTFGYGSRQYGFAQQLVDYLHGLEEWPKVKAHFTYLLGDKVVTGVNQACTYLAGVIWQALQTRVTAAFDAMEWMRESVGTLARHNVPIEWTVPGTGLRVRQEYYQLRAKQINTVLAGSVRRPSIYEATANVRAEKQMNAISPNFVHSLDAAVLMHTVLRASEQGIDSFAMVHDSYGTQAGRAHTLACVTREAFVEYYLTHNPIDSLHQEFIRAAEGIQAEGWEGGAEISAPPAPGDLNIREVLSSPYFFS
jgi:DNA-directed RNA polymerase